MSFGGIWFRLCTSQVWQTTSDKKNTHTTKWIMKIIARKIKEWGICSNENTEAYIMKRIGVISSWNLDLKEKKKTERKWTQRKTHTIFSHIRLRVWHANRQIHLRYTISKKNTICSVKNVEHLQPNDVDRLVGKMNIFQLGLSSPCRIIILQ